MISWVDQSNYFYSSILESQLIPNTNSYMYVVWIWSCVGGSLDGDLMMSSLFDMVA